MSKPFTNEERRRLVARWQRSKESARDFASRHNVALSTFYQWARRFADSEESPFTEVEVVQPKRAPSGIDPEIEVELDGVIVRVGSGVDAATLRRVLEVLRAC